MSCLFNSLGYFINENSYDIRQKICDYLQQNLPIIEGIETSKILEIDNNSASNYITSMRSTTTLGGAIEIQAACNIWRICINVRNDRDQIKKPIQFIPINNQYEKSIHIYWTGGHYEPIRS
jgi:hypothetical protein